MKTKLNSYQTATENIKHRLKKRGITYAELAKAIGMSESGVKKIFSAKDGSFQRLSQICQYSGISLVEVLQSNYEVSVEFNEKQQNAFLSEPRLFYFYWMLVYERAPLDTVEEKLELSKKLSFQNLRKLDELGLLKLLPGDRLRLPSIKAVKWYGDGPFIRKIYKDWAIDLVRQLAKPSAVEDSSLFLIRYLQMTPKTRNEMMKAQRDLEQEFVRRSIHEMRTEAKDLEHVRWVAALDNRSFLDGYLKPEN